VELVQVDVVADVGVLLVLQGLEADDAEGIVVAVEQVLGETEQQRRIGEFQFAVAVRVAARVLRLVGLHSDQGTSADVDLGRDVGVDLERGGAAGGETQRACHGQRQGRTCDVQLLHDPAPHWLIEMDGP
jgi:hypothetical protein